MAKQNADNYVQYYPPHHFIFLPMTFIAFVYFLYRYFTEWDIEYAFYAFFMFCFLYLVLMQRQHYALGLQDRLIKQELRFRYFTLSGNRLEHLDDKLTDSQLFATRYASDVEFVELLHKAAHENLTPDEIRHAIKIWKPDNERL